MVFSYIVTVVYVKKAMAFLTLDASRLKKGAYPWSLVILLRENSLRFLIYFDFKCVPYGQNDRMPLHK